MYDLKNKDLVVIDVETSGINPFRHDVLAVGLAPLNNALPSCVVYIRPETIEWSPFARQNFDKYSSDWQALAVTPAEACDSIEKYLAETFSGRNVTPIGHNIGFDVSFLRRLAFLGGRDQLAGLSHRAIDTHTLLYLLALQGKAPESATNSDGAFKHFGINIEENARHTALGDAKATRELLLRLLDAI